MLLRLKRWGRRSQYTWHSKNCVKSSELLRKLMWDQAQQNTSSHLDQMLNIKCILGADPRSIKICFTWNRIRASAPEARNILSLLGRIYSIRCSLRGSQRKKERKLRQVQVNISPRKVWLNLGFPAYLLTNKGKSEVQGVPGSKALQNKTLTPASTTSTNPCIWPRKRFPASK